jgi:hypothetical protein
MTLSLDREIIYPDSDGQPIADNTQQFRWIVLQGKSRMFICPKC